MTDTPISHISDTALWVAAFRALESERPDALFHDPLASALVDEKGRSIARDMPYPKILAWMMAVRTVAIDRLVLAALEAGVDTVVNIGAGLDTRPYRLDLSEDLRWIEIDFPHMIAMKNSSLSQVAPRCRVTRIGLDVSDRAEASRVYHEIGSHTQKALVITEGVVTYLAQDEARRLAEDLRRVPSFQFWIQDYRKFSRAMPHPRKLKRKLKHAPFRFLHPDPLQFFAELGWGVRSKILAFEEAERLGRPFPISFPWNLFTGMIPKVRRDEMRQSMGYVLLEAKE